MIYGKIKAIIEDLGAISKDKTNVEQRFKYRGIDQFYNALHPLFAKYGVFSVPETLERTEQPHTTKSGGIWRHVVIKMKYTFFAEDGSSFESIVFGEGLDSGDKATNKAMAIAHKYCLLQVFCVATEDMEDPDEQVAPERVKQNGQPVPVQTPPVAVPEQKPKPPIRKMDDDKPTAEQKVNFQKHCEAMRKLFTEHNVPVDTFTKVYGDEGFIQLSEVNSRKAMHKIANEYRRIMGDVMVAEQQAAQPQTAEVE